MGKPFASILGIILAGLVLYLTYDNNRLEGIIQNYTLEAVRASEEARTEQAKQQQAIADDERKAQSAQKSEAARLEKLENTVDTSGCLSDVTVIDYVTRLFDEAADNKYLPKADPTSETRYPKNAITPLLTTVGHYGQCAKDYNDLRMMCKASDCF